MTTGQARSFLQRARDASISPAASPSRSSSSSGTVVMSPIKPLPQPNAVTQRFWSSCAEGRFELQVCRHCGKRQFPPRAACAGCHSTDLQWQASTGRGTIYSFSVVHRAPLEAFKADVPYVLAIVELEEGVRAMMNVRAANPASVAIISPSSWTIRASPPRSTPAWSRARTARATTSSGPAATATEAGTPRSPAHPSGASPCSLRNSS